VLTRPLQSLFGVISLQTGTELISLALIFNKVTGVYGLLAILTGYQLSLLQLSTYVYSIGVLGLLVYLIPHIRKQSPFECLALAWLYILDTVLNGAYTAAFGLEWYFASSATDGDGSPRGSTSLPGLVVEGLARDCDQHATDRWLHADPRVLQRRGHGVRSTGVAKVHAADDSRRPWSG